MSEVTGIGLDVTARTSISPSFGKTERVLTATTSYFQYDSLLVGVAKCAAYSSFTGISCSSLRLLQISRHFLGTGWRGEATLCSQQLPWVRWVSGWRKRFPVLLVLNAT